ncbi:hypothetical protein HanIR_Chr13g0662281 [Helianthus annuus]|nr:hypothetical protein HanIR_Chr13g0662281 [Helianthus annuus]KAJ0499330.1 hypothetical protein HanHA89_Chr13g0532921 [Helianthus annuus]KAJ0665350.1 hypothetical protein HanLR1_Chr13g0503011 [Helianthus annuus]
MAAFISDLYEKLASATSETRAPYVEMNSEIKKLERSLFKIQDVLTDASQKEITDQSVKRWLNELQHLAYDIDDVLDDIATEAMHRELIGELETDTSKVQSFSKVNDMNTKLHVLIEQKDALRLVLKDRNIGKKKTIIEDYKPLWWMHLVLLLDDKRRKRRWSTSCWWMNHVIKSLALFP